MKSQEYTSYTKTLSHAHACMYSNLKFLISLLKIEALIISSVSYIVGTIQIKAEEVQQWWVKVQLSLTYNTH